MRRVVNALVVVLALICVRLCSASQSPDASTPVNEYVLGDHDGVKVVARVKSAASFADEDWLRIDITNSGPAAAITSTRVDAPAQYNGRPSSNILPSLTLGPTLPAGAFTTLAAGAIAGSSLGLVDTPMNVTLQLRLDLTLIDGRSVSMAAPKVITFTWVPPNPVQLETLRREAADLLDRLGSIASPLSLTEMSRLRLFIRTPAIGTAFTLDKALAAVRRQEVNGTHPGEAYTIVSLRWPSDPAVAAFYREELASPRGPDALFDLAVSVRGPWDDSFIDPIVTLVESVDKYPNVRVAERPSTISHGLIVLDRHASAWASAAARAGEATIARRLSKAVLTLVPDLTSAWPRFYQMVDMLALTHDREVIPVLRRFLTDKTIDDFTSNSSNMPYGVTPMRHSEVAANGICRLLGEPILFDPWKRAAVPRGGPYPEWIEWDQKLAALQRRLDAR